jgi:hypothetical protein
VKRAEKFRNKYLEKVRFNNNKFRSPLKQYLYICRKIYNSKSENSYRNTVGYLDFLRRKNKIEQFIITPGRVSFWLEGQVNKAKVYRLDRE